MHARWGWLLLLALLLVGCEKFNITIVNATSENVYVYSGGSDHELEPGEEFHREANKAFGFDGVPIGWNGQHILYTQHRSFSEETREVVHPDCGAILVVNDTRAAIDSLYIKPVGDECWGENHLAQPIEVDSLAYWSLAKGDYLVRTIDADSTETISPPLNVGFDCTTTYHLLGD